MKRRSPAAPLLLPIITLGIYTLVWHVKVKNELNKSGIANHIPSAWLLIVPIGNIFWLVSFSRSAKQFNGTGSTAGTFWLLALLGPIGEAILQARFNRTIKGGVSVPVGVVPAAA
jgi:Domain of unknown function (DUF4234)